MVDLKRPPTFRDIAAKAGYSVASVSLALRDDPRITEPVKERIRKVAEEMGYRPNPLLSAYQASVRSQKTTRFQAVLGWINDWPDENAWQRSYMKPLIDGARERGSALGYKIDEIWMPTHEDADMASNFMRWERILSARGIHGVILPYLYSHYHYVLPWKNFSVVCIGKHHSLIEESTTHIPENFEHHLVSPDYAFNIRLAVTKLRDAGCRRIGLVIGPFVDAETDHSYSAHYSWFWLKWPTKERIPILFSDEKDVVKTWAKKHRPDAVICAHSEIPVALAEAGFKIPEQTRVVHLNFGPDVPEMSGVDPRRTLISAASVDILTAHLQRNERGVPPYAKEVLIEGTWVEGKT